MTKALNPSVNPFAAHISGKGSKARLAACSTLTDCAYTAESGKAQLLEAARISLGDKPSDALIKVVRRAITVGIAAQRMPVTELPRDCRGTDSAKRIAFVADLEANYQAPSTAVAGKVPALRKGSTGWRSAVQHRIIRNAEDRASKYLAELGASNATTELEKNQRKSGGVPSPHHGKGNGKAAAPDHSQLVTPAKPETPQAFAAQMLNMISTAMHYANKHAKAQPLEFNPVTEAVIALHKLALKADGEMHVRIAAQDAERASRKRA